MPLGKTYIRSDDGATMVGIRPHLYGEEDVAGKLALLR
jgi:hypothetical protein